MTAGAASVRSMRQGRRAGRVAGMVLGLALAGSIAGPGNTEPDQAPAPLAGDTNALACEAGDISVTADDPALAARVCDTARRALPQLAQCHLPQRRPISVEVKNSIADASGRCFGLFHCGEDRIELLTPEAIDGLVDGDNPFLALPTQILFDSVLVHEMAHAFLDQAPGASDAAFTDHEYIAYAMQMQFLPDAQRDLFLAQINISGPPARERLNPFVAMMNPSFFAAAVWLHFSAEGNGCALVRKLVEGRETLHVDPF